MYLESNLKILRQRYPNILGALKENNERTLTVEESIQGGRTLFISRNGRKEYLHSKYNPKNEAAQIIRRYDAIDEETHVIFYGLGLGYHIEYFCELYPNTIFSIYEPNPEILQTFLTYRCLDSLQLSKLKNFVCSTNREEVLGFLYKIYNKGMDKILIVELPSHKREFPELNREWLELVDALVRQVRNSWTINLAYQERWTINSVMNLKDTISSSNIFFSCNNVLNKPALLVAAGPSLDDEIDNIRMIKKSGKAYLFTVGTAINTLLNKDIYPDAMFTYDPTQKNHLVFKNLIKRGINEIPLIYGTSVGFETLQNYPGPKYHFITSQDTVTPFLAKLKNDKPLPIVSDASSIAVVATDILCQLGFNPIILVGQNLGYRGKKAYASGIEDRKTSYSSDELADALVVKDVYGNNIYTNRAFNRMRIELEALASKYNKTNILNTTNGGARINGAEFYRLSYIMTSLDDHVVCDDWLLRKDVYSERYFKKQATLFNHDYVALTDILSGMKRNLDSLYLNIQKKDPKLAQKMIRRVNKTFQTLRQNVFFACIIAPKNRAEIEVLVTKISNLSSQLSDWHIATEYVEVVRRFFALIEHEFKSTNSISILKLVNDVVEDVIKNETV